MKYRKTVLNTVGKRKKDVNLGVQEWGFQKATGQGCHGGLLCLNAASFLEGEGRSEEKRWRRRTRRRRSSSRNSSSSLHGLCLLLCAVPHHIGTPPTRGPSREPAGHCSDFENCELNIPPSLYSSLASGISSQPTDQHSCCGGLI